MEELLAGLNERQREAVTATEGYVRVAAGAGSGKTRVLTARYAFIAKALGVSPDHILSVTFTNKAAQEMKRRIRAVLPEAEGGWILTFHSACHKILREEIGKLAYPSNFMVIDEEDQKELLQKIFRENGLTLKDFSFRDILDALEYYKSEDDYVPFLTDPLRRAAAPRLPEAEKPKSLHAVILQYLLAQRKNYYLDFNDLIQFTLFLFDTQPKVLEKWQKHFEYIQIDEFQDVSGEQYKLARLLSGLHGNLFIVGDPDQTIYSWRGADVGFFLNFPSLFKGARTVVLDKNYRSVPPLLDACNSLIAHNADRLEKKLVAVKTGGSAPVHFHARSRREECEWIAQNILGLRQRGIPLGDIAVLYRGNYMSRPVEEALLRKKVPYRVYGGVAFYRRKEIKDALAYLRGWCSATTSPFSARSPSPRAGSERRGSRCCGSMRTKRAVRCSPRSARSPRADRCAARAERSLFRSSTARATSRKSTTSPTCSTFCCRKAAWRVFWRSAATATASTTSAN